MSSNLLELGELKDIQRLWLSDNDMTGTIPAEVALLASNGTLEGLAVHGTYVSGAVPESLCSIDVLFDCNEYLCGCNCTCESNDVGVLIPVGPGEALEWTP